jgi:uncharacterized protein YndB with AHSA1/START domain
MTEPALSYNASISIIASPSRVMWAFFDAAALAVWWQTARSVTIPRVLGAYAVEWHPTDFKDDVLGRLGGVFHGTVMAYKQDKEFFVADAFWLPPDGDPIGPMAFEVACTPAGANGASSTHLRVTQQGYEESERWRRYYEVIGSGWERALASLKSLLEK